MKLPPQPTVSIDDTVSFSSPSLEKARENKDSNFVAEIFLNKQNLRAEKQQRPTASNRIFQYIQVFSVVVVLFGFYIHLSKVTPIEKYLNTIEEFQDSDLFEELKVPHMQEIFPPSGEEEALKDWVEKKSSIQDYTANSFYISNATIPSTTENKNIEEKIDRLIPRQCLKSKNGFYFSVASDQNLYYTAKLFCFDGSPSDRASTELDFARKLYNKGTWDEVLGMGMLLPVGTATANTCGNHGKKYNCLLYPNIIDRKANIRQLVPEEMTELPDKVKQYVCRQLLVIMLNMHSMGIVHGNICEANIFIDRSGRVILGGFEHSAKVGEDMNISPLNCYSEPEMLLQCTYWTKTMKSNFKTDVYALGTVFRNLFHGSQLEIISCPSDVESAISELQNLSKVPTLEKCSEDDVVNTLISELLCPRRNERISSKEILTKYKNFIEGEVSTDEIDS